VVRRFEVCHIARGGGTERHALTPFAVVDGANLVYPPEQTALDV
jgi:hypothetical protein